MKKVLIICILLLNFVNLYAQSTKKKLLIVTTSSNHPLNNPNDTKWGCYLTEVADFYGTAHKYGYNWDDIDIVSPLGGKVPIIDVPPFMWSTVLDATEDATMRSKLNNSLTPSKVNADDYNIVYYAGGYSCLVDFPNNTEIQHIAASIYENGGKVGAVCDGIAGLIPITLSNGKALVDGVKVVTNAYNKQQDLLDVTDELAKKGAVVSNQLGAVTDKNVVTGKNVQPVEVTRRLMMLLGNFPTSINNVNVPAITCYPNPATTDIKVNIPGMRVPVNAKFYSVTGVLVSEQKTGTDGTLQVSMLTKGNYTLVIDMEGTVYKTVITKL